MATFEIEYFSETLDMARHVSVIYPDAAEVAADQVDCTDIPVLYLLHGMSGNENSWRKRTAIERLVRHTNLIVVMPNTDLAWYTNTTYGLNYYDAIAKELPTVMQRFFPNMSKKREKTFIAGLSMGGYGAFKIGLTTNQYAYVGAFSGALGIGFDLEEFTEKVKVKPAYWQGVFGELSRENVDQHTIPTLAKQHDMKSIFYTWCGKEDFLFTSNQKAVKELLKMGLDLESQVSHGTHDWYYWEQQLQVFLKKIPVGYVEEERLS